MTLSSCCCTSSSSVTRESGVWELQCCVLWYVLTLYCDRYGVWGSRTQGGLLYSSRNLDYQSDTGSVAHLPQTHLHPLTCTPALNGTGINRHKLAVVYHIDDPEFGGVPKGGASMSLGFSFGLGALAGLNQEGVTVSEMNLDNDVVTFSGVPFPLRLRMVLEGATDLTSAMQVWNATNNTNSFNFLIGSAADAIAVRSGSRYSRDRPPGLDAPSTN